MKPMQKTDYKVINGDEWKIVYTYDKYPSMLQNDFTMDYYKKRNNKKWYQRKYEHIGSINPLLEDDVIERAEEIVLNRIAGYYEKIEEQKNYEKQLKEFFHQED